MKTILSLVIFFVVPSMARGTDLTVMTFNTGLACVGPACILHEQDDPRRRAPLIGAWLKLIQPDVIFLQEVTQDRERQTLKKESGYPYLVSPGSKTGLAILSKYPIKNVSFERFHWQASTWHDCRRLFVRIYLGVFTGTLVLPDGTEIALATTHTLPRWPEYDGFSSPADIITPERKTHILQIRETVRKLTEGNRPILMAGDFNMNQDSEEYRFFRQLLPLEDVLKTHCEKTGSDWNTLCTFCADNPFVKAQGNGGEKILDYLWISPKAFEIKSAQILATQDALSDHRPVIASLHLKENLLPQGPDFPALSKGEKETLSAYFSKVAIHPYCWFTSPLAGTERRAALQFLQSLASPIESGELK